MQELGFVFAAPSIPGSSGITVSESLIGYGNTPLGNYYFGPVAYED
jgi:hypothetical protein